MSLLVIGVVGRYVWLCKLIICFFSSPGWRLRGRRDFCYESYSYADKDLDQTQFQGPKPSYYNT